MTTSEELRNEIAKLSDVEYTIPVVSFPAFEDVKKRAEEVAEYIDSVNLTEENEKQVKEILANSRKLTTALEDRRKEIKREITAPVKCFESQVKEITEIIENADSNLRSQITALEENAREEKENTLLGIWNARMHQYTFGKYVKDAFSLWLEPRYLNKSASMKSVEGEMVTFMENVEKDVSAILAMPDAEEVMTEYAATVNLRNALEAVRMQREYREKTFADKNVSSEDTATFVITGKAYIALAEKLFEENGIYYRRM